MIFRLKYCRRFIFSLSYLGVIGCENPSQMLDAEQDIKTEMSQDISVSSPEDAATSVLHVKSTTDMSVPLNCPVMIAAHSNFRMRETKQYLSFSLQANPDFNPQTQDVCQGDIKNLWPDLKRFGAQIEAHMPYIDGIQGVDRALKSFPTTEHALKIFIDDAANDAGLHDTLDVFDRSTLEGGMKVDHTIIRFILKNQEAYFAREHTPIIDSVLSNYDLKMQPYQTEKLGYCYHPYEICRSYNHDAKKAEDTHLKLERLTSGFSWYQFEPPN